MLSFYVSVVCKNTCLKQTVRLVTLQAGGFESMQVDQTTAFQYTVS